MKKLLLISFFACPIFGMHSDTKSFLKEQEQTIRNTGAAAILLNNAIIVGVAKGGCTLLGPVFLGGALATLGAKKAYDFYTGNN